MKAQACRCCGAAATLAGDTLRFFVSAYGVCFAYCGTCERRTGWYVEKRDAVEAFSRGEVYGTCCGDARPEDDELRGVPCSSRDDDRMPVQGGVCEPGVS
jgi:hypothetical protein